MAIRSGPGGHRRRFTACALGLNALIVAACGSDSVTTADSTTTTSAEASSTPTTALTAVSSAGSSSAVATTSTVGTILTATTWAGTEADLFVETGDELGVVGIEHDEGLDVRAGPGPEHALITSTFPLATVVATGDTWQGPESFWYEVATEGGTGWALVQHLAFLGVVDDATSEVVAALGGLPEASTMEQLGRVAVEPFLSTEPTTRVILSVAPSDGDPAEVTFDLMGLGDDALGGYRMHVFGSTSEKGDGFVLEAVERTHLCTRGLSGELCV